MAAAETARLIASLELKDNMSKGLNSANAGVGKLESRLGGLGGAAKRGVGTAIASLKTLGIVGAAAAGGILVKSIALASDLAETTSKVSVVFKENAAAVLAFGETSAAAIGLSKNAALAATATYGNLFVSMGLGTDQAADMSTKLVTLAGDLASFNNIDPTEAAEKLRAGLTGESEPLKSLGININETIIKAKALELGLVKTGNSTAELKLKTVAMNKAQADAAAATKKYGANSTQALTATVKAEKAQAALEKTTKTFPGTIDAATKAQAAYALIFEQSATAQGDFGRTSSGLANQQRILKANVENLGSTLGTALLPSVAKLVSKLNELAVKSMPAIKELGEALPGIFDAGVAFVEGIPWDQVATGLQAAGSFAKTLFGVFTSMPPEVQATIVALAGLNKLTGGGVINLGKIAFEQFAARGATPATPLFVADVAKGLGGSAVPGAAGGALGLASKVFLVGEAIGLALLVNQVRLGISEGNTNAAKALTEQSKVWLALDLDRKALEQGLAGVEAGILDIARTDPQGLVSGESLAELKAIRLAILDRLKPELFGPPKPKPGAAPGFRDSPRTSAASLAELEAILARGRAAGFKPKGLDAAQATNQKNLERLAAQQIAKTEAVTAAIKAGDTRSELAGIRMAVASASTKQPIVNVTTNVTVTAANVQKSVTVQNRAGPPGGSRDQSKRFET